MGFVRWIGARGLFETSEGRYGSIAAEMSRSGDWITPRLNGIERFEKPPLSLWAMAASLRAFGESETALRLPGVLAALVALACAVSLAGSRERARWTVALAAASPLFFALAQVVTTDVYLAACSAASLAGAARSLDPELDPRRRARALTWAAVAAALGFMVKGPVILVLTLGPVLCEALYSRDKAQARAPFALQRLALFAVIALPWYFVASARTPGLLTWFLGKRMTGAMTSSEHFHSGSFFYYVPVCMLGFLPASAMLCSLKSGWRELTADRRLRLCACAVFFPLVVLTLSASKLVTYVLPLAVPLAVLAAEALERGLARRGLLLASILLALIVVGVAVAGRVRGTIAAVPRAANACFAVAGLVGLLGAVSAFVLARRQRLLASCRSLVAAQVLALLACVPAVTLAEPQLTRSGSGRDVARTLGGLADEGRTILCYRCFVRSIPFYTGRRVVLADYDSEMDAGYERSQSEVALKGPEALRAELARAPAAILCRTRQVDQLEQEAGPLRTVSTTAQYTILVSDPDSIAAQTAARN